jgi:[acyl-carrier-protein] S-malonyltransferase
MGVTAILFPGQGSQTPDMRETVSEVRPDLISLVEQIVGEDPFARAEEGTRFAQPAIFCASLAGWEGLGRPDGDMMAGHSLGELAALVASGCLSERDGLELVALRGKLMQESGDRGAFADASAAAKELGLRPMELPVTGAFHSPMMAEAVPEFEAALADVEIAPPRVTVLSAVTAAPFEDVRAPLAQALTMPVRWRETMLAMRDRGGDRFVEVGPGRVLTGLVKRTLKDVELAHA